MGKVILGYTLLIVFSTILFWDYLSSHSEIWRNIILILTPIIGLPLALWRSSIAANQAVSSQKQADATQKSILNERYQRSVDMLGHENLAIRCGGIYALSHLSRECSKDYHIQIMASFCAFLRSSTQKNVEEEKKEKDVVGADKDKKNSHLKNSEIILKDDVNGIISFIRGRSEEQCSIEKKYKYTVNLENSNLFGTDFHKSSLTEAQLKNVNFTGATFLESNLTRTKLVNAIFTKANCKGTIFTKADLTKTDFTEAICTEAIFTEANLAGAVFKRANLKKAKFINMISGEEDEMFLRSINFIETNLMNSDFTGAKLKTTNFIMANCTEAIFIGADLTASGFTDSDFTRANLKGANLAETYLTEVDLKGAKYDLKTIFPDGFDPNKAGMILV